MSAITVYKRDHTGKRVWGYPGELAARGPTWVQVVAPFSRSTEYDMGVVVFRPGDVFTEWHYADRWYNIFRVADVADGHLKGWYCNISRPALITADTVEADDMALDLFVLPDGNALVLDEEEFAALDLPDADRRAARAALDALLAEVAARRPPFDEIRDQSGG